MAKFDPKKADLNKDGKLSDYESNVGKKRAAAMKMGHSPKKMGHSPKKMGHSPMKKYGDGYAMKMGSKEIDSPSAFNMKDAANIAAASPMMKTDPGDTPDLESMERNVSLEQIKHYYPGSNPYYIGTVKRGGPHDSELGSYKGDYIPGTHDFMDYAQLRDMSKMTGADTAKRQGQLGAKRLAGVLRRARSLSGMTYDYANPEHTRRMHEKDEKYYKSLPRKTQYLDSETREAFKGSRYAMDQVKKSELQHKYLQEQMKLEFEGLPSMGTKGPTFNKLKGNVLTSLPAGVPKVTFGGKTRKRKGKTGVGKFLSNIGDAISDINISLPKKTKRSKGSNRGPQGGVNPRRRNKAAAKNRRRS
jgi:hypothetical protein